jgi:hypothetical protein
MSSGSGSATIFKEWFRVRDSYGVDVAAGQEIPLVLAITVAIDSLTRATEQSGTGAPLPRKVPGRKRP